MYKPGKRLIVSIILANLLFSLIIPTSLSINEDSWWNKDYSYRQELRLPINTSSKYVQYQPIDISIKLKNPCWVKNKQYRSLRIIFQKNGTSKELESQIYNLNYSDQEHINSCNIVFLIPKEADGKEKYYVYYDGEEKPSPSYPDRVAIDESYYRYEPVQGCPFESWYYKIIQDKHIIYTISQAGKFMDSSLCQQITKVTSNTTDFLPEKGEQLATFNLIYWYKKNGNWNKISTSENLVSKETFEDGNLMVKFGIMSNSSDKHFQTKVIYKYYYCPGRDKRLSVHVKHEIVKSPVPQGDAIDVFYAALISGGFKSSSTEDSDFGSIPPFLHVYTEENRVFEYNLIPHPDDSWETVLGRKADVDLGNPGWVSVDNGENGKAHAIIFASSNVLQLGEDERDGIEVQAYESRIAEIPGVVSNTAYIYLGRNTYEPESGRDSVIPDDFTVEFDAEFFTTENGGYDTVEQESQTYQSLVSYQPTQDEDIQGEDTQKGHLTLMVYPHLPLLTTVDLLSSKLLMKGAYITAELYHENSLMASGTCGRIEVENGSHINWKNVSFFRKIRFPNLLNGTYLIKIWLENSIFEGHRRFIGVTAVDLRGNEEVHVMCKQEGTIHLSVKDQNENDIADVTTHLLLDGITIVEETSDENGELLIRAPCTSINTAYTLRSIYDGFVVDEELINLGFIKSIFPLKKTMSLDLHNLKINIKAANDNPPSFDINMFLIGEEMDYQIEIPTEKISQGKYLFRDLYPSNYVLTIQYKSFIVEKHLKITNSTTFNIKLYDVKLNLTDTWNLPPDVNIDITLATNELKESVMIYPESLTKGKYIFSDLYPANYSLNLRFKSVSVNKNIQLVNERQKELQIVFPANYTLTTMFFDIRGNPLTNASVRMIRGGKQAQFYVDYDHKIVESLPPGVYNCKIYSNDQLIGKRNITIANHKTITIVTTEEPIYPLIIMIVAAVVVALALFFFIIKKRDVATFLKILAVALVSVAVISPWWILQGSSETVESSTQMFLIPTELVTLTTTSDVIAGELLSPSEHVISMVTLTLMATVTSCILIILSIVFKHLNKKRLSFLFLMVGALLLIGSLVIYYHTMMGYAETGIGKIIGSGPLDVSILGAEIHETLTCNWGLAYGFYLVLLSTITIVSSIILIILKSGDRIFCHHLSTRLNE